MIQPYPTASTSNSSVRTTSDFHRPIIELYADGHVKYYGEKNDLPFIFNRPYASNAKSAIIVDDIIHEMLPWSYREVYYPGMVRKTANVQKITLDQIQDVIQDVRLINSIGENKKPRYRNHTDVLRALLAG